LWKKEGESLNPTTPDAYQLLHDGSLALAEVESNGMRIDVKRLDRTMEKCDEKIRRLKVQLEEDEVGRAWKKEYGGKTNMGSRSQLSHMLFDVIGCESKWRTKTGRHRVDEEVLEGLDLPFVRHYLKLESLKKLKGTYLQGVKRELAGEWLRPSFNLHLARTHRSSSDSPNFQNIPIRDPNIGKAIRSCFIPRDGHVLVEIDYGALEFRICASFWKDTSMVAYASDPKLDIHRDMAMECYKLTQDQVTKQSRF
jgi:DNA polymerase-1